MSTQIVKLEPGGAGLHEITAQVAAAVVHSGVGNGLCTLFLQHT